MTMTTAATTTSTGTYSNPVYAGYLADPFVLRHQGVYWACGTGHRPERDGRQFPVLRSPDLARWEYVGGALTPLHESRGGPFDHYWAPEVAYNDRDGRFYLYYSGARGGDENHRLRVAVSD